MVSVDCRLDGVQLQCANPSHIRLRLKCYSLHDFLVFLLVIVLPISFAPLISKTPKCMKQKKNSSSYLKMQVSSPYCFSCLSSLSVRHQMKKAICPPVSRGLRPPLPIIYGFISNTCQQRKRRRGRRELSSGLEESPSCRGGRQSTSVCVGLDSYVSTAVLCKWIAGSWLGGS